MPVYLYAELHTANGHGNRQFSLNSNCGHAEGRFRAAAELHSLSGRSTQISRFGLVDGDLVATGGLCWVSLSRRDVAGSLATAAVAAGLAARVFRVHRVCEARYVLSMIPAIRGDILLAYALRGLP